MYKLQDVAREVAANIAMGIPAVRERRVKRGRTVGASLDLKARSILAQFEFFMGTIGWERIRGRVVAEIGPGDAIPLAPLFLGAGARKYVAVDRFLGAVTGDQALALYEAVLRIAPQPILDGLSAMGCPRSGAGVLEFLRSPMSVALVYEQIEATVPVAAQNADFIVSFNVCEHLANPEQALRNMAALLAPDGVMVHRIDYGPHDLWTGYENPLAFLTVPAPLWRSMSGNRGCPNRMRHREVVRVLESLGLSVADRVGTRASDSMVAKARPHLSSEFRHLSDQDIGVLDAELACGFGSRPQLGPSYVPGA